MDTSDLITPKEAAVILNRSVSAVSRAIKDGRLEYADSKNRLLHRPRLMRQVTRLVAMPRYCPNPQDNPEKPGGEGWLVNSQQQLVCQFKPDTPSAHGQWVSVRTYRWIPPRQPVPQTQRRMLRHNAVEACQTMLKTGWQRWQPPMH